MNHNYLPSRDNQHSPSNKLYVRLDGAPNFNDKDLYELFIEYGKITNYAWKRGYGFVEYQTVNQASDALNQLQSKLVMGKKLFIDFSSSKRERFPVSGTVPTPKAPRVYIGNYDNEYTHSNDLKSLFSGVGEIVHSHFVEKKGYGFVEYNTIEEAERAISLYNGYEIHSRKLLVNYATIPGLKPRSRSRSPRSLKRVRYHSPRSGRSLSRSRSRSRSPLGMQGGYNMNNGVQSGFNNFNKSNGPMMRRSRSRSPIRGRSRSRGHSPIRRNLSPSKDNYNNHYNNNMNNNQNNYMNNRNNNNNNRFNDSDNDYYRGLKYHNNNNNNNNNNSNNNSYQQRNQSSPSMSNNHNNNNYHQQQQQQSSMNNNNNNNNQNQQYLHTQPSYQPLDDQPGTMPSPVSTQSKRERSRSPTPMNPDIDMANYENQTRSESDLQSQIEDTVKSFAKSEPSREDSDDESNPIFRICRENSSEFSVTPNSDINDTLQIVPPVTKEESTMSSSSVDVDIKSNHCSPEVINVSNGANLSYVNPSPSASSPSNNVTNQSQQPQQHSQYGQSSNPSYSKPKEEKRSSYTPSFNQAPLSSNLGEVSQEIRTTKENIIKEVFMLFDEMKKQNARESYVQTDVLKSDIYSYRKDTTNKHEILMRKFEELISFSRRISSVSETTYSNFKDHQSSYSNYLVDFNFLKSDITSLKMEMKDLKLEMKDCNSKLDLILQSLKSCATVDNINSINVELKKVSEASQNASNGSIMKKLFPIDALSNKLFNVEGKLESLEQTIGKQFEDIKNEILSQNTIQGIVQEEKKRAPTRKKETR